MCFKLPSSKCLKTLHRSVYLHLIFFADSSWKNELGLPPLADLLNPSVREISKWQTPQVGTTNQNRAVIGYLSGQDEEILPAWGCLSCSCNNILPKSRRVHESFLLQNIFHGSKTILCDFSVTVELENEQTRDMPSLLHVTGFLFRA